MSSFQSAEVDFWKTNGWEEASRCCEFHGIAFFCEHGHLVRSEEIEFWLSDLRICPFRLNFDEFTFQSVSVFFYIWRLGDEIGWSISCKSRWRVGSDVSKFQLRGEMNRNSYNDYEMFKWYDHEADPNIHILIIIPIWDTSMQKWHRYRTSAEI